MSYLALVEPYISEIKDKSTESTLRYITGLEQYSPYDKNDIYDARELIKKYEDAFVLAVPGSPKGYLKRKATINSLAVERSRFATIVHPSVVRAPDSVIGYNTLLMAHVVVSCGVRIGNHCIVLPNTVLAHDSSAGDYGCIGSNVSISGSVCIGSECYIGSGVKIRENIRIGERTLIGLGSNVNNV
jgi:UDP-3-O-[3-hydroxymyristoyl] glucosamine N-acyltransferase